MRTPSPEPFFRTRYMEFTCNGISSIAAGFYNPNHAAAAICALFPFCWGWGGKWRWVGRIVGVALCVMLAMTYSRTGIAVLAIEAGVLWWCEIVASKAEAALPHPLRLWGGRRCCGLATPVAACGAETLRGEFAWRRIRQLRRDCVRVNRARALCRLDGTSRRFWGRETSKMLVLPEERAMRGHRCDDAPEGASI